MRQTLHSQAEYWTRMEKGAPRSTPKTTTHRMAKKLTELFAEVVHAVDTTAFVATDDNKRRGNTLHGVFHFFRNPRFPSSVNGRYIKAWKQQTG
jgi:hypothetical protein